MVTIKQIAKEAGVAQGTVSNVLNAKGNVSSNKIKLVMQACKKLGYIPNESAKNLRKGNSHHLALILPYTKLKKYMDFQRGFLEYAKSKGFNVLIYNSSSTSQKSEKKLIEESRANFANGIAIISNCLADNCYNDYEDEKFKILYVERKQKLNADFIGFDYTLAGKDLAQHVEAKNYNNIVFISEKLEHSNISELYNAFLKNISKDKSIRPIFSSEQKLVRHIIENDYIQNADCIVCSCLSYANIAQEILESFCSNSKAKLICISPSYILPNKSIDQYELNYRLLGYLAAKKLIYKIENKNYKSIKAPKNYGFKTFVPAKIDVKIKKNQELNILNLNSPNIPVMKNLAKLYKEYSGININIDVLNYSDLYNAYECMDSSSKYDILRLDVNWLPWFSKRLLEPLENLDNNIKHSTDIYLNGLNNKYAYVNNKLFALPFSPSSQILVCRKDLFEAEIYKRLYYEKYNIQLKVPKNFDEYNQIASFFTKSINPESPTEYGTSLTIGSSGIACSEFLARLFCLQENLYDKNYTIDFCSSNFIKALEQLIEAKQYTYPNFLPWWTDTAEFFASGKAAMAILYSNFAFPIVSSSSKVLDNVSYSLPPGSRPILGGGCLGISKYSKNKDIAINFLKWLCSEPISNLNACLGGISPSKKSYEYLENLESYPWMKISQKCFDKSSCLRVPENLSIDFSEREFTNSIALAVNKALYENKNSYEALKFAKEYFENSFSDMLLKLKKLKIH